MRLDSEGLERALTRCRRGDQDAWALVVRHFSALIYSICRRCGLEAEDSSDVFQTVCTQLYRNLDRLEKAETMPKWMAVTTAREAVRVKRIGDRNRGVSFGEDTTLEEVLATDEEGAHELATKAEQAHQVRAMLAQIPERCQKLLTLLYFEEDVTYSEVSESMGMPVGAIGPTRARCLEKLRAELNRSKFFEVNVSDLASEDSLSV